MALIQFVDGKRILQLDCALANLDAELLDQMNIVALSSEGDWRPYVPVPHK